MDRKDELLQIKISRPELALLDSLVALTGTSRSGVVRRLIPGKAMIRALGAYYSAYQLKSENLLEEFIGQVANFFMKQMTAPSDANVDFQIQLLCKGSDREEKISELYVKWISACRDVEGYRFEPVCLPDKKEHSQIAVGPDDDPQYVELMKNECRKLLKESVEFTEKLLKSLGR